MIKPLTQWGYFIVALDENDDDDDDGDKKKKNGVGVVSLFATIYVTN